MLKKTGFILSFLLCISSSAFAQFYSFNSNSQKGGTPGVFDFYVLALSWSPGFCTTTGNALGRAQCSSGSDTGFTVHGLWPQFDRGFPSECGSSARSPSRIALQKTQGVYPDVGLARYEWRKHGTCSGLSPSDYFEAAGLARSKIIIPQGFQSPKTDQTWSPVDIARAFVAANQGLRTDMMSVACKKGVLEEIRICFNKDLRGFHSCPELARSSCRAGEIKVPAVR